MTKTRFVMFVILMILGLACKVCAEEPDMEALRKAFSSSDVKIRRSAAKGLAFWGDQRRLKKDEIDLLLNHLKSEPDWSVKCWIINALQHAANTDWVVEPLILALQDRDEKSCGSGLLPLKASRALMEIGDARALPAMREWLKYLEAHPDVYKPHRYHAGEDMYILLAKRDISDLEKKVKAKERLIPDDRKDSRTDSCK